MPVDMEHIIIVDFFFPRFEALGTNPIENGNWRSFQPFCISFSLELNTSFSKNDPTHSVFFTIHPIKNRIITLFFPLGILGNLYILFQPGIFFKEIISFYIC
jgi:hypothetical protein